MIAHLMRGLLILGERWWSGPWIAEAKTAPEMWVRRGLKALLTVGVFRVACAAWWLALAVLLAVVVKALRAATKDALGVPEKTAAPTGAPAEPAAGGLPEVSPQEFLELLYDVLGTARGVHLRTIAHALIHRVGGAWEVADVRRLCEAAEVAVTPTIRAPGGKPTVGVYRVDIPPLPQPLPEAGVVDPANPAPPATTPRTTPAPTAPTTPTRTRVGDQLIVSTDDPDNPARTHVQVIDIGRKKRA